MRPRPPAYIERGGLLVCPCLVGIDKKMIWVYADYVMEEKAKIINSLLDYAKMIVDFQYHGKCGGDGYYFDRSQCARCKVERDFPNDPYATAFIPDHYHLKVICEDCKEEGFLPEVRLKFNNLRRLLESLGITINGRGEVV